MNDGWVEMGVSGREKQAPGGSAGRGLVENFREFSRLDFVEGLPAVFELFESLYDRLGHAVMRFGRTADDGELFAGGKAFVAVGVVQADAEEAGLRRGGFSLFGHASNVLAVAGVSSGFSPRAVQTMSVKASFWAR